MKKLASSVLTWTPITQAFDQELLSFCGAGEHSLSQFELQLNLLLIRPHFHAYCFGLGVHVFFVAPALFKEVSTGQPLG